MFCQKCGEIIINEAVACPYCGAPTINYVSQNNTATPKETHSSDYPAINEFYGKTKAVKVFGILSIVTCFGIGIIFALITFIMAGSATAPSVKTTDPKELAELETAEKNIVTGRSLALLSFAIFCCLLGVILMLASS